MSQVLDLIFPRRCFGCNQIGFYICPKCRPKIISRSVRHPSHSRFEGVLSCFRYHGLIRRTIIELKFDFVTDLIEELSTITSTEIITNYPNILNYWLENDFVLTPIPLHPYRQNWRGFNQSSLIFKKISSILKLKYNEEIIIRNVNNQPQTRIKNKILRRQNTTHAFTLLDKNHQNIILCDDVYTTGSTLNSASAVFPQDTNLWALTLAG